MLYFIEVTKINDIERVENLAKETWNSHYLSIIGQFQIDYMLEKFQSRAAIQQQINKGFQYFILKQNNTIAGYFAMTLNRQQSTIHLSKLYIKQEFQRSGLGKAAIDFLCEYCIENQLKSLWLTVNRENHQAINFYKKLGFKNQGILIQNIGAGFFMNDFKMTKHVIR